MSTHIADSFSKLNLVITDKEIFEIQKLLIIFETRQTASLALNSPLLGVYKIYFTDSDREGFFSIFGVTEKEVISVIKNIPSIDKTFKVSSDSFNVFAFWIMHLSYLQIEDKTKRDEFLFNIAKLIHYKFFTSIVNHSFPHGATEKIMTATINNLTKKYDIVIYGTWKKTIEARCADLINEEDSIHHKALKFADDDKQFIYIITDTSTRMKDKINNVVSEYYRTREQGGAITSRSSTMEIEGEKLLVETTSTFDTAISSICAEVMSANLFVDRAMVNAISKQFANISTDMLRSTLISMSQLASMQQVAGTLDQVKKQNGGELYVGIRALITAIIQKSFRYCIKQHIDLSSKAAVYVRIKNVYSSSRISDPDIIFTKNSIANLIDTLGKTKRDTTKSSLRLAVLLYIILKAFVYL